MEYDFNLAGEAVRKTFFSRKWGSGLKITHLKQVDHCDRIMGRIFQKSTVLDKDAVENSVVDVENLCPARGNYSQGRGLKIFS